ncbi:hypothetical protein BG004_008122, partial [Podila humilis]
EEKEVVDKTSRNNGESMHKDEGVDAVVAETSVGDKVTPDPDEKSSSSAELLATELTSLSPSNSEQTP